jgi:hypothetical protein
VQSATDKDLVLLFPLPDIKEAYYDYFLKGPVIYADFTSYSFQLVQITDPSNLFMHEYKTAFIERSYGFLRKTLFIFDTLKS